MREFGGAAMVGKAFRDSFSGIYRMMRDSYTGARLNSLMKRINRVGGGPRGSRDFDVVSNVDQLRNFDFNRQEPLSSRFFAPFGLPVISATRDQIDWTVPDFNTDTFIVAPEGATHCRLVLAGGYTSDYAYNAALESYEPVSEEVNGKGLVSYSGDIALGGLVGAATVLTVDLTVFGAIPATSALLGAIGIVFYQEINGDLYELSEGNAMKVVVAE